MLTNQARIAHENQQRLLVAAARRRHAIATLAKALLKAEQAVRDGDYRMSK